MNDEPTPESAAFFKALANGSTFKWMELAAAGAADERLDAQMELMTLLHSVAKKVEQIEAMDAPDER